MVDYFSNTFYRTRAEEIWDNTPWDDPIFIFDYFSTFIYSHFNFLKWLMGCIYNINGVALSLHPPVHMLSCLGFSYFKNAILLLYPFHFFLKFSKLFFLPLEVTNSFFREKNMVEQSRILTECFQVIFYPVKWIYIIWLIVLLAWLLWCKTAKPVDANGSRNSIF